MISMTLAAANNLMLTFLASYMGDLFIIEIGLIIVRIIFFPEIEKKINEGDSPAIYNLLYFILSIGTSGVRGGFF